MRFLNLYRFTWLVLCATGAADSRPRVVSWPLAAGSGLIRGDECRARAGRRAVRFQAHRRTGISTLAVLLTAAPGAAHAQTTGAISLYLSAFADLERHELAALALILGVLFFAVITAILLLRTHARAAAIESAARDKIATLTSEVDRLGGLLLSEPLVLVSWPAAADEPDIIGDAATIAGGDAARDPRIRHLARSRTRP